MGAEPLRDRQKDIRRKVEAVKSQCRCYLQLLMFRGEGRPVWSPRPGAHLSLSVFGSHSASEKAGHVVRTLPQLGLQTYTD